MGMKTILNMGFGPSMDTGFDTEFTIFMVFFIIMFVVILGIFIAVAVRGISRWNKNNNSPRLTVCATVIAKRTNVTHHHHNHGVGMHGGYSTRYFVTFQVESGDRMELEMYGEEFGLLVEGDRGYLSFQGTRYLGFERM